MNLRHVTLLSLIATTALIACGRSTKGGGAVLSKTYGPGGRQSLGRTLGQKGCLNLVDLRQTIANEADGATMHSRDYDLGQMAPGDARQVGFKTATDAATVRLLAHRASSGPNAPTYVSTASGAELLSTKPAADLLGIEEQTACATVKFKSGAIFRIQTGDAASVRLYNAETRETREYIHQPDSLVVNVFAPVTLETCEGHPSPAKFERISSRFAWGSAVGSVKLVDAYARRLGLGSSQVSYLKFQSLVKTLPTRADAPDCPAR